MTVKGLLVVLLLPENYVLCLSVFVTIMAVGHGGTTLALVELYGMCR